MRPKSSTVRAAAFGIALVAFALALVSADPVLVGTSGFILVAASLAWYLGSHIDGRKARNAHQR